MTLSTFGPTRLGGAFFLTHPKPHRELFPSPAPSKYPYDPVLRRTPRLTFQMPRRSGKAIFLAAPAAVLASCGLISVAQARAPRPARVPAHARPAAPLAPLLTGRSPEPVSALLVRDGLPAAGTNNAVRLWVHGDASGADLRVRVLAPSSAASPAAPAVPRDEWISAPIPVSFSGWREFVLPQSKFTLRAAPAAPASLDMALPAGAQPVGAADAPASAPDWAGATGLALDVTTTRQTTLVVDDIAWVTLDANGQGTGATPATSFEQGNVGAWKPVGTPESALAVSYGLATKPGLTHGGRVAFQLTVTPPGLVRQTLYASTRAALFASRKPLLPWQPISLFARVLPDSLPLAPRVSPDVTFTACAEQTAAATFCLYSPSARTDVAVSLPQDLQGIGHVIPKSGVEVHVVQIRPRSGAGMLRDADTSGLAPALLVKDDRVPLAGAYTPLRLIGPAVCDIPADTSKQFWLTVNVPRNTPNGSYIGRFLVSGRGFAPFTVRTVLNVLPLRLLSPAKQYGIDLRSRLDAPPAPLPSADGRDLVTDFVSKDTLDRQLADIYAHGFTIASLYDSPETLWNAVNEYRDYGFGTPYNLYKGDGDPKAVEKARGEHQAPALTYYTDPEPNAAAASRMAPLSKAGIPNATYIPRQSDFGALGTTTDIAVYNRDSAYPQQLLRNKGQRVSMIRDWWYWPAADSDPVTDRVDAGLLLWRSNLYGAFLPDYQTAFGADPYDESSAGAAPSRAAFRPAMLTYPVKGGVLDTLQWEACREGVTDVRYLTTMYAALRECKDNHIAKARVAEAEGYVKAFLDKPIATLPESQLDGFRAKVADYAIQLRRELDAYNKVHDVR